MIKMIQKIKTKSVFAVLMASVLLSAIAHAQSDRNISAYNLANGVGLKGYDPVAIFPEGGGVAKAGNPSIRMSIDGVTYLFSSQANLDLFKNNPDKYEPTYGGWCAFAMATGAKVDIAPDVFTINGNRANYFINTRAKRNFDTNLAKLQADADGHWKRISGESPRL